MPPRTTERDYWPCLPIVEDGTLRSIARRAKREKLALARDAFAYNAEQLRNA